MKIILKKDVLGLGYKDEVNVLTVANYKTPNNPPSNPGEDPEPTEPEPNEPSEPEVIPEIEIEDPDVPLAEPEEIIVEEPEVPLAPADEVEIEEEDVPLTDVPKTADNTGMMMWLMLAALSAAVLLGMKVTEAK